MSDVDTAQQLAFLRETVNGAKKAFKRKKEVNWRNALTFRIGIVAAGVVTTILLGLKEIVPSNHPNWSTAISFLAFAVSASLPIALAWESFHDYRWFWIRYNRTLNSFYALSDEIEFKSRLGPLPAAETRELFDRVQATFKETDDDWHAQRMKALSADGETLKAGSTSRPHA